MPRRALFVAMFAVAATVATAPAAAADLHVNAANTGDPRQDGSPDHPFATIQAGIDASSNGDTVLVAAGTYTGDGNRDLDFGGRLITVRSVEGPEQTVIDCQGSEADPHRGFTFENGETPDAVVAGLTIRGGVMLETGGGIRCSGSSPTFVDCIITENLADGFGGFEAHGGGVRATTGAPTFIRCVISDNTVRAVFGQDNLSGMVTGGGIRAAEVTMIDCRISGNTAHGGSTASGGGLYAVGTAVLEGCDVIGNDAKANLLDYNGYGGLATGGGLHAGGSTTLVDCTFSDNKTAAVFPDADHLESTGSALEMTRCAFLAPASCCYSGGYTGVRIANADATVIDCRFTDHPSVAVWSGGHGSVFVNCLFAGNYRALSIFQGHLVNCTLTGNNFALYTTGTMLTGCVVWDNGGRITSINATYCLIEGGWPGVGNIDADPMFVDAAGGDYRLAPGSPCIDAGDSAALPAGISTDLAGGRRFVDDPLTADTGVGGPPVVDMGAYEFQLPCPDTNGDGVIDVNDLNNVIVAWGTGDPSADVSGDGVVDVADLSAVVAAWGSCP